MQPWVGELNRKLHSTQLICRTGPIVLLNGLSRGFDGYGQQSICTLLAFCRVFSDGSSQFRSVANNTPRSFQGIEYLRQFTLLKRIDRVPDRILQQMVAAIPFLGGIQPLAQRTHTLVLLNLLGLVREQLQRLVNIGFTHCLRAAQGCVSAPPQLGQTGGGLAQQFLDG